MNIYYDKDLFFLYKASKLHREFTHIIWNSRSPKISRDVLTMWPLDRKKYSLLHKSEIKCLNLHYVNALFPIGIIDTVSIFDTLSICIFFVFKSMIFRSWIWNVILQVIIFLILTRYKGHFEYVKTSNNSRFEFL